MLLLLLFVLAVFLFVVVAVAAIVPIAADPTGISNWQVMIITMMKMTIVSDRG